MGDSLRDSHHHFLQKVRLIRFRFVHMLILQKHIVVSYLSTSIKLSEINQTTYIFMKLQRLLSQVATDINELICHALAYSTNCKQV